MSNDVIAQLVSEADAAGAKASAGVAAKSWHYSGLFANPAAAVNFVNAPPAQQAGEAVFSVRENGRTDVFIFL